MSPVAVDITLAALCVLTVLLFALVSTLFVLFEKLRLADDKRRATLDAALRRLSRAEAELGLPGSWDEPTWRRPRPTGNSG